MLNSFSTIRLSRILIIVSITLLLLYLGKALFIPLSFGLLIAIIMYPVCKWLEGKKWPRAMAVFVLIFIIALLFFALLLLLAYELNIVMGDMPLITEKATIYFGQIRLWFSLNLGILPETQNELLDRFFNGIKNNMSHTLGNMLSATSSTVVTLFLIPIFSALFLFHRRTFVSFLATVVGEKYKGKLTFILQESITSYFKYVKGTFFVYCIVGVLNSVGLLILGIDHAVTFGMLTAFMSVIPYAGIMISAALPVAVALITKDSLVHAIGVISVFSVVQYLEATLIFPKIVGAQLNLSTWAVIVAMIVGTVLWGLAGMILFIPFAAILKIFSDNLEELKAVNILLKRDVET